MRHLSHDLSRAAALLWLALLAAGPATAELPAPVAASVAVAPAVFASVGDSVITHDEYSAAFSVAARGKFYHGKPQDSQIAALQREVGEQLVTSILLLREARRQGLSPDAAEIEKKLQAYEQRYAGSAQWKKNREQALPPLRARLEQESLLGQLEKAVRSSVKPDEAQVKAYYAAHQVQFTEPEQLRVSVVLLKVDPSSPSATWRQTGEQAQAIAEQARTGEDFAALARQHSADESAPQGGDMGYLHDGMLPDGAQEVLATMRAGEISDAVRLLQGFAVFRLTDRKAARLHEFEAVKMRAQEFTQREQSDAAWTAFVAELKARTPVTMDTSRFLPLAEPARAQAAASAPK